MSREEEIQQLIINYNRRLQKLKELEALQGFSVDPKILLEIEDIEAAITELQTEKVDLSSRIPRLNLYRGLYAFGEQDAEIFFGRETFTNELAESVEHKPLVAVLGPSGSGKSSIVFAGLLHHLRGDNSWLIATFRPGRDPFRALAAALLPWLEPELTERARLKELNEMKVDLSQSIIDLADIVERILEKHPHHKRMLIVADQFEELYTLSEPDIDKHFVASLLQAIPSTNVLSDGSGNLHLILTLRADFLTQALNHRPFADVLRNADVKLGPMTPDELRRAIEKPAETQGVTFEAGLVERILTDVSSEPGHLPLLEFALTALWNRQKRGKLTHDAYEVVGRVEGALSRHAEMVLKGLSDAEQRRARRVFVQMVRLGEGTEDTRRLANRTELAEADWPLVQRLATERLVVTDRDPNDQETVEVVHETLIRSWGRLSEWMKQDRTFRAWQERLRVALRQWQDTQQDDGALLRGAPLSEAENWLEERNRYTELSNLVIQNCQSPPEIGQLERMTGSFGRLANW